jgi:hypothetical protein
MLRRPAFLFVSSVDTQPRICAELGSDDAGPRIGVNVRCRCTRSHFFYQFLVHISWSVNTHTCDLMSSHVNPLLPSLESAIGTVIFASAVTATA